MKDPGSWSRKQLNYEFNDPELLNQALTHKSFAATNNERLEFLGDSVLGYTIADALFRQEPDTDEGGLTRLRALLVRGATLTEIARSIGLGEVVKVGGGEARSGEHQRDSIVADALEAVFGAILLDGGSDAVRTVILQLYQQRLAELPSAEELKDPKSRLQEALQARGCPLPDYEVLREAGPAHARHFEVECSIASLDIRTNGSGSSRRVAEQEAAGKALVLLADD